MYKYYLFLFFLYFASTNAALAGDVKPRNDTFRGTIECLDSRCIQGEELAYKVNIKSSYSSKYTNNPISYKKFIGWDYGAETFLIDKLSISINKETIILPSSSFSDLCNLNSISSSFPPTFFNNEYSITLTGSDGGESYRVRFILKGKESTKLSRREVLINPPFAPWHSDSTNKY